MATKRCRSTDETLTDDLPSPLPKKLCPSSPATDIQRPYSRCRKSSSWAPEDDERLRLVVEDITAQEREQRKLWSLVAAQFPGRNGKQCRERWLNQLRPGIRRDPWTTEEEKTLVEAQRSFGNQWVIIAGLLPGRTDNSIKNHFNSMLRRRKREKPLGEAATSENSTPDEAVTCHKQMHSLAKMKIANLLSDESEQSRLEPGEGLDSLRILAFAAAATPIIS